MNINDLTIWCSYHDSKLIYEYNLDYVPTYIKLFNTNYLTLKEDNINYLNKQFCEVCTLYYVWKNNLYSKYIGFCHYRRFFNCITENMDAEYVYYMQLYDNVKSHMHTKDWVWDLLPELFEYLRQLNIFDEISLYKVFYDNNFKIYLPWKISFILPWDKFIKLCEIYFGFLEYILGDYKNINLYSGDINRLWAWRSEYWIAIIISLINNFEKQNELEWPFILPLLTYSNNVDDIILWIKKNNRINPIIYYIITELNEKDKKYILSCISDVAQVNFIKNESEICEDYTEYITLDINKYIKCKSAIDFNKGIYTIEKIK